VRYRRDVSSTVPRMASFIQSGSSCRNGASEKIVANAKSWNEFAAVALNAALVAGAGIVQFGATCAIAAGVDVAAEADRIVCRRASSFYYPTTAEESTVRGG
jgi:sigma54-dependent transcription regulator